MKDKKVYTNDEIALFEAMENEIDNGTCKPLEVSQLDEKKKLFKQAADKTIEQTTKRKVAS